MTSLDAIRLAAEGVNAINPWLAALGALVVLSGAAGVIWANLRSKAVELTVDRLRSENEDYVRRLNYLEPRTEVLERENKTLRALHNPADAIDDLKAQEASNHKEAMAVLRSIDRHVKDQR